MVGRTFLTAVAVAALACGFAEAADTNKGQAELDQALELRITAKSASDLQEIIRLCTGALDKGLDDDNAVFAKQLLASAYYQRGSALARGVLESPGGDPRLPQFRTAAVGELSAALKYDPKIAEAYLLIARLQLLPGGDTKQAKSMLDAALALKDADAPTRAKALTLRSPFHSKTDDRLADLNDAILLNADDPQPWRLRAALKLSLDKPAEAVADFDAALKLEPSHAATHEARGLALAAQQKWDEAKQSLTTAAKLLPQSAAAVLQRGRVSMLAGDSQAALADAEAALKLTPDMPEAIMLRSHANQALGNKKEAMADVDLLLGRFPNAQQALKTRVMYLIDDNRTADALKDLEHLNKLDPDDGAVLLQMAVLYNSEKRHAEAVEIADRLLKTEPSNWRALRVRADSRLNSGKQREAIADYEAALKVEPADEGILNNLAWVLATSPDDKLRNGKRAVELAEKASQATDHKAPHILSTLAAAYAEQGDFAAAIKWTTKALEVAKTDDEKASLRKEQASYEAKIPWRELLTGAAENKDIKRK